MATGILTSLVTNSEGFSNLCSTILPACWLKNSSPSSSFCSFFEITLFSFCNCFLLSTTLGPPVEGLVLFTTGWEVLVFLLTDTLFSASFLFLSSSDFLNSSPSILFFSISLKSILLEMPSKSSPVSEGLAFFLFISIVVNLLAGSIGFSRFKLIVLETLVCWLFKNSRSVFLSSSVTKSFNLS